MQQKFIPFSPFKPKIKSDNLHGINNITVSQWPKKAKLKRGNCTSDGAVHMNHKGACHGSLAFGNPGNHSPHARSAFGPTAGGLESRKGLR